MEITRRRLKGLVESLRELGNRFAPTLPADIKISRLLTPCMDKWEEISIERTRIQVYKLRSVLEQHGVKSVEELPQSLQILYKAELSEELAAWDKGIVEIELPDIKLTQADLPKERAGENGWQNGSGLGAIIAELHPLFEYPKE